MRPRFAADHRLLFWMLVLLPAVPAASLMVPPLAPWLLPVALYLAYCTGVASHWHNHCPVFHARCANQLYSVWLSVFYGYPVFAWVPTHNQNHHKFVNGEGDATRTSRYAREDTFWRAVTYPFASALYQAPLIAAYVRRSRRRRPLRFLAICCQYAVVLLAHAGYLWFAVHLHGASSGVATYALALGLPSLSASWAMMFTNYLQHVGCDADSADAHSRNFTSPTLNWWVFDAGYHTVHHEHPGLHWSHYRRLHEVRSVTIPPHLQQSSPFAYCWSTYVRHAPSRATTDRSRRLDVRYRDSPS